MTSVTRNRCRRPTPGSTTKNDIEGFTTPDDHTPTQNEIAWTEMLRAITGNTHPPITLRVAQALRRAVENG